MLKQLNDIKAAIKINFEMIEKINNNNNEGQKIDKSTQQEIKQLLTMLEQDENMINQYQNIIETLKKTNSKNLFGIFYKIM